MKIFMTMLLLVLLPCLLFCQQQPQAPTDAAQIIFNGGYIVIANNANLIVQNPQPSALTVFSGGGIISEGAGNNVIWNIENNSGYIVPFVAADGSAIPVSFNTKNASGTGTFALSTYTGSPDPKNIDYLPPGVANVNRNGADNSSHVIDRFWKLDADGYTKKPALSKLNFSYRDIEWNENGNMINESTLAAQRWNSDANEWNDFSPAGIDNIAANKVSVASIKSSDLYAWWTLVDSSFALPVQLISFTATTDKVYVLLNWKTGLEINTNYFTVEKTKDMRQFAIAGTLPAVGNSSNIQYYSLEDKTPFTGTSFYRLKTTDKDGRLSYSQWQPVNIGMPDKWQVYPNPATDKIYIIGNTVSTGTIQMQLVNANGSVIKQQTISNQTTEIPVNNLAAGSYIIRINDGSNISIFNIIKR